MLCYDLMCGLGGWRDGFAAEGFEVIGYDIERHDYGTGGYKSLLVIQDVLTVHGSELKNATCIVASPPCQKYSYMAMPWTRAKALAAWYRESPTRLTELSVLFNACFRIQREASEAAGGYIPMVVENVRGAERWVGAAKWHFGRYYLWGDVPALMPKTIGGRKLPGNNGPRRWEDREVKRLCDAGVKVPGIKLSEVGFNVAAAQRYREEQGRKNDGGGYNERGLLKSCNRMVPDGTKVGGGWFGKGNNQSLMRKHSSRSNSRKALSAQIAKIPFALAQHIARCMKAAA